MKKILNLLVLIAVFSTFNPVNSYCQGFQIGYINSENKTVIPSTITTKVNLNGIQVGPTYQLELTNNISANTGLLYSFQFGEATYIASTKITAHNIDLPIHITLNIPINKDLKCFAYSGPNFTYEIAKKAETTILGFVTTQDFYDDKNLIRFNLQAGVGGGVTYKKFTLKAGYDWGLTDRYKASGTSINTNSFKASINYLL